MKKEEYIEIKNLSISENLYKFINDELLPGSKISSTNFWNDFSSSVHELAKKNKELLEIREDLQNKIDNFHKKRKGIFNIKEYQKFLYKINYIKKQGPKFKIKTKNIDEEISKVCAPQLVCPISNSRFLLNAANARWVSLYDSLYGTDIIESEESASQRYDPERGLEVIRFSKKFLDKYFKIKNSTWIKVHKIEIEGDKIYSSHTLENGSGPSNYGIEIANVMGLDKQFIKDAFMFRARNNNTPTDLVNNKRSRYNSKVIVDCCEICGSRDILHSHHINEQQDADENGIIKHFPKNIKHNIQILCQECHIKHHNGELPV